MTKQDQTKKESLAKDDNAERRDAARWPAPHVPWFRDVKLISGPEVQLLNVSRGGALLEGETYLSPRSMVAVRLDTTDATLLIKGRVLRSVVASESDHRTLYHTGIAFDQDLHIMDSEQIRALFQRTVSDSEHEFQAPLEETEGSTREHENEKPMEVLTLKTSVDRSAAYLSKIFGVNDW